MKTIYRCRKFQWRGLKYVKEWMWFTIDFQENVLQIGINVLKCIYWLKGKESLHNGRKAHQWTFYINYHDWKSWLNWDHMTGGKNKLLCLQIIERNHWGIKSLHWAKSCKEIHHRSQMDWKWSNSNHVEEFDDDFPSFVKKIPAVTKRLCWDKRVVPQIERSHCGSYQEQKGWAEIEGSRLR